MTEKPEVVEGGGRTRGQGKKAMPGLPLISVVTIVRNGEASIDRAIRSVLSQTYPNVEYIVVDGGSTDRTLDILRGYGDRISYWKSEKDSGISDAFNKGIGLASGEIVGILNADDWYEADALEKVASSYLEDPGAGVIYGWMNYWRGDELSDVYRSDHSFLDRRMSISHPASFVAKRVYDEHGVFDLSYKYAMDYELILRFFRAGVKFVRIEKILSNMSSGGASFSNWERSFREMARAKSRYIGTPAAYAYFSWQLFRKYLSIMLFKAGFGWLIGIYRRLFIKGVREL
jgi:glycosyltransferase involved in cell wall biosynthesis